MRRFLPAFPACSSSASKRHIKNFDPMDVCVASESHRRKKATTTGKRAKRVNVVLLPSRIPKGRHRNKLKKDGRIIDLAFHRSMTLKETIEVIVDAFKDLGGVGKLQFLLEKCDNTIQEYGQQEVVF